MLPLRPYLFVLILLPGTTLVAQRDSMPASKSGRLTGTVASIVTTRPVPLADVRLVFVDSVRDGASVAGELFLDSARTRVAMTDTTGTFHLRDVAPGHYLVDVRRLGYEPFQGMLTIDSASVEMELAMTPAAAQLPELSITERTTRVTERLDRVGFTRRSKEGNTLKSVSHERIVADKAANTTSLLEHFGFSRADRFLLDGLNVEWKDLEEFPIEALAAFEVYRSEAMLPVEFTRTLPGRQVFRNNDPPDTSGKSQMGKQPTGAGPKFPEPGKDTYGTIVPHWVLIWTYTP